MERRNGLQAELLVSLGLVMMAATAVLAVVLVSHHERALRELLSRALVAEARANPAPISPLVPGTLWWEVDPEGPARGRGHDRPLDEASAALARSAYSARATLFDAGSPTEPVRLALPLDASGRVAVAKLPLSASRRLRTLPRQVALGVLLADAFVFTAFGATLLRRRVVLPFHRLRDAASAIADGDLDATVPVQGTRETAEVATVFNAMSESLGRRTRALEKAVTDLRAANVELRSARAGVERNARLASVGRLAAGVAHEVGNPMGAILAFLDLVGRDPSLSADARGHLERAGREGERVRRILRHLLDFSRPAAGVPAPVDVAALAERAVELVRTQNRHEAVVIRIERDPQAPLGLADGGLVVQILLNLLLNAAEAVRDVQDPEVVVRVAPAVLARRPGDGDPGPESRREFDAVECSVRDNGPGVPVEDEERIFDPFYTTRPPGEGTGLGLSNALRMAEQCGGSLELVTPGSGAVFVLRLPAVSGAGSDRQIRGEG